MVTQQPWSTGWKLAVGVAVLVASPAFADPPGRVARLSFVSRETVSFRPASVDTWVDAVLNYPVTTGDSLWVDPGGRAELQIGTTAVRLAPFTQATVLTLDDRHLQLRLSAGSIATRVRSLGDDETIEIDTPNGSIDLLRPGFYRVDVDQSGEETQVTVRTGEAEATASDTAFTVRPAQTAVLQGVDDTQMSDRAAGPTDEFEDWCAARDRRVDAARSIQYVSPGTIGVEDLDEFGTWEVAAGYGSVWVPRVQDGWAPYREGRWVWIDPWGWTWVDDEPWGFAPFHYGRWVRLQAGWAWTPGAIVERPVYAPALVAFVGGSGWHASLSINEPIAWFPLAPHEAFIPVYRVSPSYVHAVNVAQVNVTNITVTNVTYVNRSVPGAVTAVSRETFVQARPVAAEAVAIPRGAIAQAPIVGTAAVVAPERVSVLGSASVRVSGPPQAVTARQVVVRRPPVPAAVPFEAKQEVLRQHPGVPLDDAAIERVRVAQPAVDQHPLVRMAPRPAPSTAQQPRIQTPSAPGAPIQKPVVDDAVAARHAHERADLEARQARERDLADKRHQQLEKDARTAQDRARIHEQNEQDTQKMLERHRKEQDALQKRQDSERKARDHGGSDSR